MRVHYIGHQLAWDNASDLLSVLFHPPPNDIRHGTRRSLSFLSFLLVELLAAFIEPPEMNTASLRIVRVLVEASMHGAS